MGILPISDNDLNQGSEDIEVARGAPDFGMYAATAVIASLADMGELGARLGSPDVFDRRGNVVFIDSFDHDLIPYDTDTSGTGADVEVEALYSRLGAFACKLTCGSTSERYAQLKKLLPYPSLTKWGLEIGFHYNIGITVYNFSITLIVGTTWYRGRAVIRPASNALYYVDSAGSEQLVASDLDLHSDYHLFHILKLVIDLDAKDYVRVILNETQHSLADIDLYSFTGVSAYEVVTDIQITGETGENEAAYIDEFIVTQNEP